MLTPDMETLQQLLSKKEDLHDELKPYFDGTHLRHPLVYSIYHFPHSNALINARYLHKLKAVEEAKAKKDYGSFIFLHERPYRLEAFLEIMNELEHIAYWELLADIWIDTENMWQNLSTWKQLLNSPRPMKKYFMNPEDREFFRKLPDTVVIYRGYHKGRNKRGLSWTLDYRKAQWFAKRLNDNGLIATKRISKSRLFAYLSTRGESEIIFF